MRKIAALYAVVFGITAAGHARMVQPRSAPAAPAQEEQTAKTAKVEVLFLLDTTGSMGGLIQGAKEKIWSIANEIASGNPTPQIRMGLVAYRDQGDSYVTKVVDLNADIDQVYEELLALQAGGGGDGPEHVLKALSDAAQKISWDDDASTFRVAYLVGDAPGHEDYNDTPGLEALTKSLIAKGVIINTIQCGQDGAATAQWRKIAKLGDGHFLAIAQNGGVSTIATPFDEELSRLNRELDGTMLGYGAERGKAEEKRRRSERIALAAPASASAERAAFKAVRGFESSLDFVTALAEGTASLDSNDMPEPLRDLAPAQRREKVAAIEETRLALRRQIGALSKDRAAFLKKEEAKSGGNRESFDAKLLDSLKTQAAKKGLRY